MIERNQNDQAKIEEALELNEKLIVMTNYEFAKYVLSNITKPELNEVSAASKDGILAYNFLKLIDKNNEDLLDDQRISIKNAFILAKTGVDMSSFIVAKSNSKVMQSIIRDFFD